MQKRLVSQFFIFNLDDTLCDESTYVMNGLCAVADFGSQTFGWDADYSFKQLWTLLKNNGRGRIVDDWLVSREQFYKKLVKYVCMYIGIMSPL